MFVPAYIFSIDGPDFSGKTTISNLVVDRVRKMLEDKDFVVKKTHVPSNLITGSFTQILRNSMDEIDSRTFALAYGADHLHHYHQVIQPLKEAKENYVVIQERSLLTTYLYQGVIGKSDLGWMDEINKYTENVPAMSIILKLSLDEMKKRKSGERRMADKFESDDHIRMQSKVYYEIPETLTKKFNVKYVEASDGIDAVVERCAKEIYSKLQETSPDL